MNQKNAVWITWEHQRRSMVLAEEFGAEYHELLSSMPRLFRYINLSIKTLDILFTTKPAVVFVQNPSMLLTLLACLYRKYNSRSILIVDRHSNFFPISNSTIINHLHNSISTFTLKVADLTIVTNEYLKSLVTSLGGSAYILEDKIPTLDKGADIRLKGKFNVLYICSFDLDEPFEEVFKAAELLSQDTYVYVTGNFNKVSKKNILRSLPQNVVLLGYLTDADYIDYLYAADALVVLSEWEHTLLCGAYEGVALEKPLILSNKKDLLSYFRSGVIPSRNDAVSIAKAIKLSIENRRLLTVEIKALKKELSLNWQNKFDALSQLIESSIPG
jgi:glycosyltransferase involved in cell wall biosynthesis